MECYGTSTEASSLSRCSTLNKYTLNFCYLEYNVRNYQGDGKDMDESVSNVIAMLNREDVLDIHGGHSESDIEDEGGGEYEESDE